MFYPEVIRMEIKEDKALTIKSRMRAFRRELKARHKETERLKNAQWQRCADMFKVTASKKGRGQAKKYKGVVMPTSIALNDRCSKGWAASIANYTESMKTCYLYSVT